MSDTLAQPRLHPRRHRAPPPARLQREGVPGLLHVRHPRPRPAASGGWPQAGAAAHPLRHVRVGPLRRLQAQEVRPHRRRRPGQVPPPWRHGLLRGHGAHGPVLLLPLPPHRRPGQLGLPGRAQVLRRHALHRGAPDPLRRGPARRTGAGHRGLAAQFRRHPGGTQAPAGAPAQHSPQRGDGHRRGHGHRHPAPQSARGRPRLYPPPGSPGGDHPGADGLHPRPRLSHRRDHHHARRRDPPPLRDRQRQPAPARPL